MLPVEFARVSSRNRLTLVLLKGVPLQPTLWALSRKSTLAEAIKNLAKREGISVENIGRFSCNDKHTTAQGNISTVIGIWVQERRLHGPVWTALGPKKPNGEIGLASDDELMDYLQCLEGRGKAAAAREYIQKAPTQIKTTLRAGIHHDLRWSDTSSS